MEKSYNGWTASRNPRDFGGIAPLVVAGESFSPGVRQGAVWTVLRYVAEQMNRRVEPIYKPGWHDADDWGFNYRPNRNDNNLSCHASATAIDYNATRHPNGKRGTYSNVQVMEIHAIMRECESVVRWGGDFTGTADEMHFEICKGDAAVEAVARKLAIRSNITEAIKEAGMTDDDAQKIADKVLGTLVKNAYGDKVNIIQILNGIEDKVGKIHDNTKKEAA
jgi:hypothetical protein